MRISDWSSDVCSSDLVDDDRFDSGGGRSGGQAHRQGGLSLARQWGGDDHRLRRIVSRPGGQFLLDGSERLGKGRTRSFDGGHIRRQNATGLRVFRNTGERGEAGYTFILSCRATAAIDGSSDEGEDPGDEP